MKTIASLFAHKTWANAELFAVLAKVPAQRHPDELHAAVGTLDHVHISDRIFRAHLCGETHSFAAMSSDLTPGLHALRSAVEETDAWFEAYVAATDEARLQEVLAFTFTDGDAGSMSREEMLFHVITHGAYHRGNVGQMLESLGIDAPRDLYTRFLHLDQPARRHA